MDTTYKNPNMNYFSPGQGGNPTALPVVPNTINSSVTAPSSPIVLPPPPQQTNDAMGANTSVPSPISTTPTVESIVNTPATATENKQQGILDRIATLTGEGKSKDTFINAAENSAGVPQLTSTFNDLNTQLEGLNNQSIALQNETLKGGSIESAANNNGIGIKSQGGINEDITKSLRTNSIKQATIASQSLTLKSAIYGAQGKLTIAKDAADKAANAQYEDQERQIAMARAQLEAIAPKLNKEEKARALVQSAKLDERQKQIDSNKEAKKTILAMATATLKLYPNDAAAHYAAQQALAESNKETPDLTKALDLVGQYQQDPQAVAKAVAELAQTKAQTANSIANTQSTYANIDKTKVDIEKTKKEIELLSNPSGLVNDAGKPLTDTQSKALGYAKRVAQSNQIIDTLGSQFATTNAQNVFGPGVPNILKSGERQQYEQAQNNFVNAILRLESGAAISQSEFDNAKKQYFPQPGDSEAVIAQKKANRDLQYQNLLQDAGNPQGLGNTTSTQTVIPTEQIPSGYYQASDGLLYKK